LASIGFSMVYRIEGFLNISHGEFLTIGAYLALLFNVYLHFNIIVAAIFSIIITAFLGLSIFKVFIAPVRRYGPLALLITSVGIAFVMHGINESIAGPDVRTYRVAISPPIKIGEYSLLSLHHVVTIVIAIISAFSLHFILTRTKIGLAFRAMATNFDLARTKGINTRHISAYIWFYASGMAALAGVLLGVITKIHPDLGWEQILIIMSVTILGGLGKIYGVMVGAFIMGLAMDLGTLVVPSSYRPAIALVIVIVTLLIKPRGIFGGEW